MDIKLMMNKILLENEKIIQVLWDIVMIIIIFILAKIITSIIKKLIGNIFKHQEKIGIQLSEQKRKTLAELLKNVTMYVVYFIAIISALQTLGIKMQTILAVAGAASVAIGLGAQSLIKDVISGFFILFEDQFAVGDYVTIGLMSGVVEVVGLRITKIRDFSGDLHIIPNGSILTVTNKSRGDMRALVDIQVSNTEDLDNILAVMNRVAEEIKKDCEYITDGPTVIGVVNITETFVTLRIVAKTIPMKQWNAEVEIRHRVKVEFDKEGIKAPYQKMVFVDRKES
ncbi:mechanosensitive ion channel family protein [Clostridium cylindrosporum]|uniref:Putative MscS family protein YkuT n=1 Tax=Clostridium cylindrosporum DSM 605 TaxID=1121307 RepID=A0A0J8G1Y7_CLOCY|nr:mechanosensitive ion channel family protein [Clostridium cylindrosporum]KMT21776.1 putative MscS family protein YkuT [Clostridium cylindrosporum DSM 605]